MLTTNSTKLVLQFQEVATTNYKRHADMNEHSYFLVYFAIATIIIRYMIIYSIKYTLYLGPPGLYGACLRKNDQNFLHICHFCSWEHSNKALWGKKVPK